MPDLRLLLSAASGVGPWLASRAARGVATRTWGRVKLHGLGDELHGALVVHQGLHGWEAVETNVKAGGRLLHPACLPLDLGCLLLRRQPHDDHGDRQHAAAAASKQPLASF